MSRATSYESFADVLTSGVKRSGLSLQSIRRALAEQGVTVSVTTLNYWCRGRTRPERPESLRALTVLEEVLRIPIGDLTALLGPRKPRGRHLARNLVVRGHDSLWPDAGGLTAMLRELDAPTPGALTYRFIHDHHRVDGNGRDSATSIRFVVRAEAQGVGSCVVLHPAEETDLKPPTVHAGPGCAAGRVRAWNRFTVAELLLDRTLSPGETAVLQYEVRWFGAGAATRYRRAMPLPARDYLLQVSFDGLVKPTVCWAFSQQDVREPETPHGVLRMGRFGDVHALFADSPSAIAGIHWQWPGR